MIRRRRRDAPQRVESEEALRVMQDMQRRFAKKRPTPANRARVVAYLAEKYSPEYQRSVAARLLADVFKRTVPGQGGPVPEAGRSGPDDAGTAGRARRATLKGKAGLKPRRAARAKPRAAASRRRRGQP
jgi:hypothetical protein